MTRAVSRGWPRSLTPRDFAGVETRNVDLWLPMNLVAAAEMGESWATHPGNWWLRTVVRLGPGVETETAEAEASLVVRRALRDWKQPWRDSLGTIALGSIIEARHPTDSPPEARVSLWLAGVSAIVLLVACANVANLLLARAITRRREIGVRLAIGVGRGRLVRQLVTETMLLALLAAAAALVIAHWGWQLLRTVLLPDLAPSAGPVDIRVLAVTGGATLLTVLLSGLAPALQATRTDVVEALKSGGREGGARRAHLRTALLVTQAALSVLLLVGAGLFIRSLQRVRAMDVGMEAGQVLLTRMDLRSGGYTSAERAAIYREAANRITSIPGVTHASLIGGSIPTSTAQAVGATVLGRDSLPDLRGGGPYRSSIDEHYFNALGAQIRRGRAIEAGDVRSGARVAGVNETIARGWWPNGEAVGACLMLGDDTGCTEVVGVVKDIVLFGMVDDERAQIYLPHGHPTVIDAKGVPHAPSALLGRTTGPADATTAEVRRRLQDLRPGVGYVDARSFEELLAPQIRPWRLGASMFSVRRAGTPDRRRRHIRRVNLTRFGGASISV